MTVEWSKLGVQSSSLKANVLLFQTFFYEETVRTYLKVSRITNCMLYLEVSEKASSGTLMLSSRYYNFSWNKVFWKFQWLRKPSWWWNITTQQNLNALQSCWVLIEAHCFERLCQVHTSLKWNSYICSVADDGGKIKSFLYRYRKNLRRKMKYCWDISGI